MLSISRTRTHLTSTKGGPALRGRRPVALNAIQTSKWDAEANGAMTPKNVKNFYDKQGYITTQGFAKPGCAYETHAHNADGYMIVHSGQFTLDFEGEKVEMGMGDICEIPGGAPHAEYVSSDDPAYLTFITKDPLLGAIGHLFQISNNIKSFFSDLSNKAPALRNQ